jgi:hypothetical protein
LVVSTENSNMVAGCSLSLGVRVLKSQLNVTAVANVAVAVIYGTIRHIAGCW